MKHPDLQYNLNMNQMTVIITDKNDVNYGKEFPGWLVFHDVYYRGGTNMPIEDLYLVTIDGQERRYVSSQIDVEHYKAQLLKKEIEKLGANIGDKVKVLEDTSGSYGAKFFKRRDEIGFHTITDITSSGYVTFDDGEAVMFRPKVEVIN